MPIVLMPEQEWFASDSILRKVSQESFGLLGGGRALLLQLAHPLIAAGVAEHNRFTDNTLQRLAHTPNTIHPILLGHRPAAHPALPPLPISHPPITARSPPPLRPL